MIMGSTPAELKCVDGETGEGLLHLAAKNQDRAMCELLLARVGMANEKLKARAFRIMSAQQRSRGLEAVRRDFAHRVDHCQRQRHAKPFTLKPARSQPLRPCCSVGRTRMGSLIGATSRVTVGDMHCDGELSHTICPNPLESVLSRDA